MFTKCLLQQIVNYISVCIVFLKGKLTHFTLDSYILVLREKKCLSDLAIQPSLAKPC